RDVERVLILGADGDPPIASDVGRDLDVRVLNEGGLLLHGALDGEGAAPAAAAGEHLAADLPGDVAPRIVFGRSFLGKTAPAVGFEYLVRRNGHRVVSQAG